MCTLRNVNSFFDIPSLIYYRRHVQSENATPSSSMPIPIQREVAKRLTPRSSSAYNFDSYGIVPLLPFIQAFIRRNCTTWDYNKRQLQALTSDVCSQYCCHFALYVDRGYTPSNSSCFSPVGAMQTDRWTRCWSRISGHPAAWRLESMLPQLHKQGMYFRKSRHSKSNMAGAIRGAVIDFEFLRGRQNETVVKELRGKRHLLRDKRHLLRDVPV